MAGAPLGGLVERDEKDKYGLARELIHPLLPWFKKVNYNGPIQVTAINTGKDGSRVRSPHPECKPFHRLIFQIRLMTRSQKTEANTGNSACHGGFQW